MLGLQIAQIKLVEAFFQTYILLDEKNVCKNNLFCFPSSIQRNNYLMETETAWNVLKQTEWVQIHRYWINIDLKCKCEVRKAGRN